PLALPPGSERISGGRGAVWRLTLPHGLRAVLRCYRRGGLPAPRRGGPPPRLAPPPRPGPPPTPAGRRRGGGARAGAAGRVEGRLAYRGAILTAEVVGAVTLLEALRQAGDSARRRALAAGAGQVVAAMHRAGVCHADLNLTNLLAPVRGAVEVTVLDFDRARLTPGPLSARARCRNLRRLARALRKLDPAGGLPAPGPIAG